MKISGFCFSVVLLVMLTAFSVNAQITVWQKPNSSLIRIGNDNADKTPLILIHGINGTKPCSSKNTVNPYWTDFRLFFGRDAELKNGYTVYVFQYCSNEIEVSQIALELRDLIDENLIDRDHVILAHSMGGLVAKSYMAETVHLRGKWKGKTGGDTTKGIITLATPHHGTPGANLPATLENHFANGWETAYKSANNTYWSGSLGAAHPAVTNSGLPNRSDLRWDNFDFALDVFKGDINEKLANRNILFQKYQPKLIAYSGVLDSSILNNAANLLVEISKFKGLTVEVSEDERDHRRLNFANAGLFYGLSKRFGATDGLVPFKSGLFCNSDIVITSTNQPLPPKPKNYICSSPVNVRRFEPGNGGELAASELPDAKTLSIFRSGKGFDHLDMLENENVLGYVLKDLKNFLPKIQPNTVTEVPTMFLLDISGSMLDNNKIEAAKSAGLDALQEMRENVRRGHRQTNVSIWTFGGDCQPKDVVQILPFTNNLTQAETTFRARIPRPDGLTPLYTAIDISVERMLTHLNSRTDLREGKIIVLSDGENTCAEQIRPRGVYSQGVNVVYQKIKFLTVGFNVPAGSRAERDLQYLASVSGGKYFPAENQRQLSRAFEKILRVYEPKNADSPVEDFERGVRAIRERDFAAALQIWTLFVQKNSTDALGFFNLAVACEAAEQYKCAVANYKKYLEFAPSASDAAEIQTRIAKLEEDYISGMTYHLHLLRSDLDYLKDYYKRLFGLKNDELSAEFAGFVAEKGAFYRRLPQILEIRSVRIERTANEFADSLDFLNRRTGSPSFDRDAVSLLTTPIATLEDLIERIETYNSQNKK